MAQPADDIIATPEERLRDAFAQLLMQGNPKAVSDEALWAMQGRHQLGGPPPDDMTRYPGLKANIPRALSPPGLDFPTAQPGPGHPEMFGKVERAQPPFPGAEEVEIRPAPKPGEYTLPKTDKDRWGKLMPKMSGDKDD
jgi:hypothetical protein